MKRFTPKHFDQWVFIINDLKKVIDTAHLVVTSNQQQGPLLQSRHPDIRGSLERDPMAIHCEAQGYSVPHRIGRTQPRQQQIREPRSDRIGPSPGWDWRQDVCSIEIEYLELWNHNSRVL